MARWSPTVVPEAPAPIRYNAIGDALESIGEARERRGERRRRDERQRIEDERFESGRAREEARYAAEQERTQRLDAENAADRTARRQGEYVRTSAAARDEGYIPDEQATSRRQGYEAMASTGMGMFGATPAATLGDALLQATDSASPMTFTRPDGTTDVRRYDPTQTRDARDEARTLRVDRARDAMKPPERDPVADDLAVHAGRLKLDKQYGAGDFRPRESTRSGRGIADELDDKISIANTRVDDARQDMNNAQREMPEAPSFDLWKGGASPVPGQRDYSAFQADSARTAKAYSADSARAATRTNAAAKQVQKWNSIADSLSSERIGLSGGEAVRGSNEIQAAAEQQRLARELNAILPELQGDPVAMKELREEFAARSAEINERYGIGRRRPED